MKKLKVDLSKNKTQLKGERGLCPYCGSENINYDNLYLDGESICFPALCDNCNNEFNEWYDLNYSGQWGHPLKKK
jgi:hypothetical protein